MPDKDRQDSVTDEVRLIDTAVLGKALWGYNTWPETRPKS